MNWKDAVTLGTTIVASLGGGGAIVFGLSGYLGRLWADRELDEDAPYRGDHQSKRNFWPIRESANVLSRRARRWTSQGVEGAFAN